MDEQPGRPAAIKAVSPTQSAEPESGLNMADLIHEAAGRAKAAGRTGLRLMRPVADTIRQEEPQTLAKIALAALTPRLINGALNFAKRRPLTMAFGVGLAVAALAAFGEEVEEERPERLRAL